MANEVSLVEPTIDFKPTPIVISNLDQVQEAVTEYVAKYDADFVVTSTNATDVRRMRASLHKVSKAFDEKRLAVQRQVKAPLAEFNTTMKSLKQQIDSVIDPLDVKLKEVKQGDETVDTETGEVVPEVITLKLTGSHKQLAQAWLGIKNLGIQVEMLSKE